MPRALSAVLAREREDDEHPPVASRISDVDRLAAGRSNGFEGRNEYLQHLDRMIVGRDVRRGMRQGSAWVVADLGIAVQLPASDKVQTRDARDVLHIGFGRAGMDAYMIGSIWGHELASGLDERSVVTTALGVQTTGTMPTRPPRDDTPIGKVLRAQRNSLMHPPAGSRAVIIERPHGALVIELDGRADEAEVAQWLASVRLATPGEVAAAEPARMRILAAPRVAALSELAQLCVDPAAALLLDEPARRLAVGDLFKCTDRVSPEPVRERETPRGE